MGEFTCDSFISQNGSVPEKTNAKDSRFRSKVVEIIFNGHINFDDILSAYSVRNDGVYALFVKWHINGKNHTHIGLIVRSRDPQKIEFQNLKKSFEVAGVEPNLVAPISKNNQSVKTKLGRYVSYLTDGHDNGKFKDSWNFKFDWEIEQCKTNIGKIMVLHDRGLNWKQIVRFGNRDWEGDLNLKMDKYQKALNNKMKLDEDQTVRHEITDFKKEALKKIVDSKWDPTKQVLILKGPSNMGKTELAKALCKKQTKKDPLFVSNLNKIRFQQGNQPIVFDDMKFHLTRREKVIHLMDVENERDIRILFGIHTIPAQTLKIFTTNEDLTDFLPHFAEDDTAISRRYCFVDMTELGCLYYKKHQEMKVLQSYL